MYSIGVIAAEQSLQNILKIDHALREYCDVTYLPYSSMEHLYYIYRENMDRFDAFLFGGSFPHKIIYEKFGEISRPYAFFNVTDRDYYLLIARLAVQRPGLNFERVYIDEPDVPVDFEQIFQRPGVPQHSSMNFAKGTPGIEMYQPILDHYHKLWDSGTVDLIVTRLSSMDKYLTAHGICHELLFTSPESMLETFHGLILRLNSTNFDNSSSCVALIRPAVKKVEESQKKQLWKNLQYYNKQLGNPFLLHEKEEEIELTGNTSKLKALSRQFTVCPVSAYLKERINLPVYVGWGCSNDIVDAYRKAQRALKEAKQNSMPAAYIINVDDVIIGPLSSIRRITYDDAPDEKTQELSERLSLSPLYISKIRSVLKQKGDKTLSAEELSFFLNITTRSASRILNKLVDGGAAVVEYNRQINLRGRPAKIYRINLDGGPK